MNVLNTVLAILQCKPVYEGMTQYRTIQAKIIGNMHDLIWLTESESRNSINLSVPFDLLTLKNSIT